VLCGGQPQIEDEESMFQSRGSPLLQRLRPLLCAD
jgi:hypothetical protein